jgi:hypothetical protein
VSLTNKLKGLKMKTLLLLLSEVKKIHENYMSNGKIFLHTIELRDINEKILVLIKEINLQGGDKELKDSSLDLIEHLEQWISIWDREKDIRRPNDNDEFIFNGYKKYPKKIENLLIRHSKTLNTIE